MKESEYRLNKQGLRVAYVLQVPELGVPAQNCALRPLTFTENITGCSVDLAVYQERMRVYQALVAKLALKSDSEFLGLSIQVQFSVTLQGVAVLAMASFFMLTITI
jgi:hypothetical protein